nr:hypothetical protein B0A51_10531 [Rachicladosporium sp. CCFEE 5018]
MDHLRTRALTLAEREKRFQAQPSELHQIIVLSLERTGQHLISNVDSRFDADELIEDLGAFKHCAAHPLLVPCIMFAANLRMSEKRRQSIKERLHRLEHSISELARVDALSDANDFTRTREDADSQRLETLYEVLHSCRKDQASREGRYGFWRECNGALDEGFKYVDLLMLQATTVPLRVAHDELLQWKNVAYHKFESLMARDKDHVNRVNTVSDLLSSLVQQRDMRLQASIARASQRDSEEMKFIAVLGSIFLPASLIATILNVPEFQFASGPVLFGAYLAITAPLIGAVMILCFFRGHVHRLLTRRRGTLTKPSAMNRIAVEKPGRRDRA